MLNANYFIPSTNGQYFIPNYGTKRVFDTEKVNVGPVVEALVEKNFGEKFFEKKNVSHNSLFLIVARNARKEKISVSLGERTNSIPNYHYHAVGDVPLDILDNAMKEGFVLTAERIPGPAVCLHKYRLCDNSEAGKLLITCSENGLKFSEDLKSFTEMSCWTKQLFHVICSLIAEYHEKECSYLDKFRDIYYDYLESQKEKDGYTACENILFLSNIATKNFIHFLEYVAQSQDKHGMGYFIEILDNANPFVTGKPYPSMKEISSKAGQKILAAVGTSSNIQAIQTIIKALEENPKVGPDGLMVLNEFLSVVGYNHNTLWDLQNFEEIFENFDITPSVLINRAIKGFFYEGIYCYSYFNMATDYIKMHKVLEIPLPKKLPVNLLEEHNHLQAQVRVKELIKYEESFKKVSQAHISEVDDFNKSHKDSEFLVDIPKESKELIMEGQALNHCVASYAPYMAAGKTLIFFVRTKEKPDKPFVTFEVKDKQLVQAHGFNNSNPSQNVKDFINDFVNSL